MQNFPYPTLDIDAGKIVALTEALEAIPVTYQMDAKASPLGTQPPALRTINGATGEPYASPQLDCSGFVRWAIYHAGLAHGANIQWPDGSVNQHEAAEHANYKTSSYAAGKLSDGAIRVAFLEPTGSEAGHVMLITGGYTCECYGHHGVGRRQWGSEPFMEECAVYVLTAPTIDPEATE